MDREMTYAEAVSIRARSLSGEKIDAAEVSAAVATIQRAPTKRRQGVRINNSTLPDQLLQLLASGPMESEDFYAQAVDIYAKAKRSRPPYQQLSYLYLHGFIRREVVLTDVGRKRLGITKGQR